MAAPQVVAQIGDWAICEDAQGEFYYNNATAQSYDTPPPELLQLMQAAKAQTQQTVPVAAQAAAPQPSEAKVVQTIGEWAICQDAQGQFYQNLRTKQSYDQPPPELAMLLQQSQPTQAAAPQPQSEAKVLQQIGEWAICRDAQGQFYQNLRTNQSYDEAPLELLALIQGQQQRPAQVQAMPPVKQYQTQPPAKQYQAQAPAQQYQMQQAVAKQQYLPQQQYQAQAQPFSYQPPVSAFQQQQTQSYQPQPQMQPQAYAYQPQQSQAPQQLPYQQQFGFQQQAPVYGNGGGF